MSATPDRPIAADPMANPAPGVEPREACDLVMKGGITSGVVYPKLIHDLSKRYRFRNIGGTSAGAIAAGACAAAEFGRQHGRVGAFEQLNELPDVLGRPVEPSKRSRLLSLFQPHPSLRPHFAVLLEALNKKPRAAVVGMLLRMLGLNAGLVLVLLLVAAALLAPLVRSLSLAIAWWPSFGTAFVALILVGVAAWRTAVARQVGKWGLAAGWLIVVLLLALGPRLAFGVPWSGALAGVALSLLVGSLLAWALMLVVTGARFALSLLHGLHRNRYGICSGQTMAPPAGATEALPGLTDWLTGYFDDLAGVAARPHPLTFGDLWNGADRRAPGAVNLEVMTSAVSQQMIYSIPFRDGTPTLYYDPNELKDYFPPRVMAWLDSVASRVEKPAEGHKLRADDYAPDTTIKNGEGASSRKLRPFPRGADLPVVVAVRMSLSFPVLLSAVPLYSVDFSRQANQREKERMRAAMKAGQAPAAVFDATRIWFSDGGIGSNLPLHMFDALLPGHPTFAVNLKPEHPDHKILGKEIKENEGGRIFLPEDNNSGSLRYWPAPQDGQPLGGLLGFLGSIIHTMQNWRDEIQFPYPGFKDRIVQISQRPSEGGLNLDMPQDAIDALGQAGGMAAQRLIDRFHPAGAQAGGGWTNHQTVRLRTFLGVMQPGSAALCSAIDSGHWAALAKTVSSYSAAEHALAQVFLADLGKLGALSSKGDQTTSLERTAPKPLAQIRITPKI
jgi:predicted acylesterase/phospholipase RssA